MPNEQNTDYRYIPFRCGLVGAGSWLCAACARARVPRRACQPAVHSRRPPPLNLARPSLHTTTQTRSGGPRKCMGDQFALMEAVVTLAVLLKEYDFSPKPGHDPGMTTGATIHTKNGLYMHVRKRGGAPGAAAPAAAVGASA